MDQQPPTRDTPRRCTNCATAMGAEQLYCSNCGQKYKTGFPTLLQVLGEGVDALFNINSHIYATLRDVMVPGKLSLAWFAGQRQRYLPPFRIFILATLAMISAISLTMKDGDIFNSSNLNENAARANTLEKVEIRIQELSDSIRSNTPQLGQGADTLVAQLKKDTLFATRDDSVSLMKLSMNTISSDGNRVAVDDFFDEDLSLDDLAVKYGEEGFINKQMFKQSVRIAKKGQNFGYYLIGYLLWLTILVIPILAGVLWILYYRRTYFYVQHFIFLLHYYALMFVVIAVAALASYYSESDFFILTALFLFIIVFLLALKKTYQQSWLKTILKGLGVTLVCNFFVLPFAFIIILLLSILLY